MNATDPEFSGYALALGTVHGSRTFAVDADGFLTGVTFKHRWAPGVNEAQCLRRRPPECEHERPLMRMWGMWSPGGSLYTNAVARCGCLMVDDPCGQTPGVTCRCGFYAYYDGSNDYAQTGTVAAVVEAWGRTVVGTRGFRAAKARIVAIYFPQETAPEPRTVTETTTEHVPAKPWETGVGDQPWLWLSLAAAYIAAVGAGAWFAVALLAWAAWHLWDIGAARRLHASTDDTVTAPRTTRRRRALRARAHTITTTYTRTIPAPSTWARNVGSKAGTTVNAAQRALIRGNYPGVPVYDDLARMLADFPPDPGQLDTTKEA